MGLSFVIRELRAHDMRPHVRKVKGKTSRIKFRITLKHTPHVILNVVKNLFSSIYRRKDSSPAAQNDRIDRFFD